MLALLLCVVAFWVTWKATKRSTPSGLISLIGFGYFYGILRANLPSAFSHFIFDAALVGFYLAFGWKFKDRSEQARTAGIWMWTLILIGWPVLVCLIPFQPLPVSLVGLRGNVLFLPLMIIGSRVTTPDIKKLAVGLACLNIGIVSIAIVEFQIGVAHFFPFNEVTQIIYRSQDGAGHLRIPATFANAHSFGSSMLISLPLLLGLWTQREGRRWQRMVALAGAMAAMGGIVLSSTRMNFVLGCLTILLMLLTSKIGLKNRVCVIALVLLAGLLITGNSRFSRYKQLDTDTVTERVGGSVNRSFFEVLTQYPLGNGLGGGGTSMPYFLQGMVRNPVAIENEYARILLEQGLVGLGLWIGFIFWFVTRRTPFAVVPWKSTRRLYFLLQLCSFASASIGVGSFTSIPTACVELFMIGWITARPVLEPTDEKPDLSEASLEPSLAYS